MNTLTPVQMMALMLASPPPRAPSGFLGYREPLTKEQQQAKKAKRKRKKLERQRRKAGRKR